MISIGISFTPWNVLLNDHCRRRYIFLWNESRKAADKEKPVVIGQQRAPAVHVTFVQFIMTCTQRSILSYATSYQSRPNNIDVVYNNDTSDCMQCVHTDVFIKTYCVMALYKCQWGYAVWCVWLHQGYFRRYIRGAHWLHGDKWPKLYHLLDFCCFSCVMSSLDIILNC